MPLELYTYLLFWKVEGNDVASRVGGFDVISCVHQQYTVFYRWTTYTTGVPTLNSHISLPVSV
jgi:hypothetical protein